MNLGNKPGTQKSTRQIGHLPRAARSLVTSSVPHGPARGTVSTSAPGLFWAFPYLWLLPPPATMPLLSPFLPSLLALSWPLRGMKSVTNPTMSSEEDAGEACWRDRWVSPPEGPLLLVHPAERPPECPSENHTVPTFRPLCLACSHPPLAMTDTLQMDPSISPSEKSAAQEEVLVCGMPSLRGPGVCAHAVGAQ